MADPKRLQIVLAVQAALQAINGAPGGYFYAVKASSVSVEPDADLWTVPFSELPYFVVMPDNRDHWSYRPANQLRVDFPLLIVARMDAQPTAVPPVTKLRVWEQLFADIERALTRDITLGGRCVDLRIQDQQAAIDVGASPQVHARVGVNTHVYRTYGEP